MYYSLVTVLKIPCLLDTFITIKEWMDTGRNLERQPKKNKRLGKREGVVILRRETCIIYFLFCVNELGVPARLGVKLALL